MKKLVITILLLTLISIGNAQITNTTIWEYRNIDNSLSASNQTNRIIDFYKFYVNIPTVPPLQDDLNYPQTYTGNVYPGQTVYIRESLFNVGNLHEPKGIRLKHTNPTGATIQFTSASNLNSVIANLGPINSGQSANYFVAVTVPQNYTEQKLNFNVTNIGSIPNPYKYTEQFDLDVIQQNVAVIRVSDGIHEITGNSQFDGSQPLGNLDFKVEVEILGANPATTTVRLWYYISPTGTLIDPALLDHKQNPPDGTTGRLRSVTFTYDAKTGNWVGTIPVTDPQVQPGMTVYFFVTVDDHPYYFDQSSQEPWKFQIREYMEQEESKHTISVDNKFDPSLGEEYKLIYKLSRQSFVNISVYNIRGELIKVLHHGPQQLGKHVVKWGGRNKKGRPVSMGLYLVNIQTAEYGDIRKVIVILR